MASIEHERETTGGKKHSHQKAVHNRGSNPPPLSLSAKKKIYISSNSKKQKDSQPAPVGVEGIGNSG